MNRVIRAKIKINSVIANGHAPRESGVWEKQNEQIYAGAVYSEDKTTENYAFSLATPSLSLQMCINNPGAFNHLIEGMEYYLDFIPCEGANTGIVPSGVEFAVSSRFAPPISANVIENEQGAEEQDRGRDGLSCKEIE